MQLRTAFLFVLLLLASPSSFAGACDADPNNNPGTGCVNEGIARMMVTAAASASFVDFKRRYPNAEMKAPVSNPQSKSVSVSFSYVPGAPSVFTMVRYYVAACVGLTPSVVSANMSLHPNLSLMCDFGCERRFQHGTDPDDKYIVQEGDATGYWVTGKAIPTGNTCDPNIDPPPPVEPPPPTCAAGQKRLPDGSCANQGDCPVGQHKVGVKCEPDGACPAGKIKGPDGSCVDEECPEGQVKASDGTCKKDDDGDGEPNQGEDTGKFSGGDDCGTPPLCSGDNILCGQARIQWRIDCNTRKNRTITGGACNAIPICTGEKCDALEYSQLLQQWRATCALEKLASDSGTPGTGDPATAQIRDFLIGTGQTIPPAPDPWITETLQPASWSSGLGQGSCPAPIETSVSVSGHSAPVTFSFQPICDFAVLLRSLLLACSAIVSLTIIAGARK